jgi:hypothetical protein
VIDLTTIFEFSRTYCATICAFLVPANITATSITLGLVGFNRPQKQILGAVGVATGLAITMCLHVATWFMIGVVMTETFILLGLGLLCLVTNLTAFIYPGWIQRLRKGIVMAFTKRFTLNPYNS